MTSTRIPVAGERPYPVLVGTDLSGELPALLRGVGAGRAALVHSSPVQPYAERLADTLAGAGIEPMPLAVPDGEKAKTLACAQRCWEALGRAGFTRTDAVVGIGGGATTDLAGFVAACWLRGVPVAQVPTSLLGMVDAAIGGKTGVNTDAGKNLVGAFHPPVGVLCDLGALRTLPAEELVAGLAEVVKCGFVADPVILDRVEADPAAATDPGSALLRELVERSVRVKADVVGADLRETGRRVILNYGHTFGHAVEKVEAFRWRHGHAVSVGLVYAAELARGLGLLAGGPADRHRVILDRLGLPTTYQPGRWDELSAAMRVDKKARGARLRFVLLRGLAEPATVAEPEPALLRAAYQEVAGGR